MRHKQFYPGEKVITIADNNGLPIGTVGRIETRWAGTIYLLRLPDGTLRWLSDRSFSSTDPNQILLKEGDFGVVTSDERQRFAKVGDKLQVIKTIYDADFYGVLIDNKIYWLIGFQLAPYISLAPL